MNSVNLVGNLTRDPELRSTPNGVSVTTLGVAVNGGSGEFKYVTFVDVEVWKGSAEACVKYLSKGSPVAISGELRLNTWTAEDGTNRQKLYINSLPGGVKFLSSGNGNSGNGESAPSADGAPGEPPAVSGDDDIPF